MSDTTTTDAAGSTPAASPSPDECRQACPVCPWRLSNRGKAHPDGWYDPENLERLWHGVRDGAPMSCHPTDTNNPVSDEARAAGYRPAPENARVLECVGALVAAQREMHILGDLYGGDWRAYWRERRQGLTRDGAAEIAWRLVAGNTPLARALPRPDLNHPDMGLEAFGLDWPDRYRKEPEQ